MGEVDRFEHRSHEVKFACGLRSLLRPLGHRADLKQVKQCFKLGTCRGHSGNAMDWPENGLMGSWARGARGARGAEEHVGVPCGCMITILGKGRGECSRWAG